MKATGVAAGRVSQTMMQAVVYREFQGPMTVESVDRPTVAEHGVVIQVAANGVCRSDWHGWMGHDPSVSMPHVPGHEMAGVVAEVGSDVINWSPGDRVVVPFSCGCGTCPPCVAGHTNICDNEYQPGFSGWGSMAQFVAVPWADVNLVRLPDAIDFASAAALGCRFMTAYQGIVERGRVKEGEWVAVHGSGGVGLSAIQIAKAIGANVVAVDLDDAKLELASAVGADAVINATNEKPVNAIRAVTGGGAQVSVDALGAAVTAQNSIRCLAKRGRHVQIGLVLAEGMNLPIPMSRVISLELEIYGSHGMPASRYSEIFDLIDSGQVDPSQLIGKTISLEQAPSELESMSTFAQLGTSVISFAGEGL